MEQILKTRIAEFKDRTAVETQFKVNKSNVFTYKLGKSITLVNIIDNKGELIAIQTLETKPKSHKVVHNGLCTIVILDNGSKGIAKCNPKDKYIIQIGYDIAYRRARIAQMEKEIKELSSKCQK